MKEYYKFVLLILPLLCGCIQEVKDKKFLNEQQSKLVISSFISPDDSILRVYVRKTRPFFNDNNDPNFERVEDAQVSLSDGKTSVNLTFNSKNNYFSAYEVAANLLPIIPGNTYFLNVSTPSGLNVKSQCIIPYPENVSYMKLDSIERDTTIIGTHNYSLKYILSIELDRLNNTENYFKIEVVALEKYIDDRHLDTIYSKVGSSSSGYLKCENNCETKLNAYIRYNKDGFSFYSSTPITLYTTILNADFYKYYLDNYKNPGISPNNQDTTSTLTIKGFPYSEPETHYTNIEGGYGIFAGYVRVRKDLNL